MSWRQFLKTTPEVLRVQRVQSPPERPLRTLPTLKTLETEIEKGVVVDQAPLPCNEPEWQYNFCTAHADFNHWRGCCFCSLDDCLLSKIIDAGDNLDKLRGLEIGRGVMTDQVIDEWLRSNEPTADLIKNPLWFICMAESSLAHGQNAA